jgi:chromosome segregation ATPase
MNQLCEIKQQKLMDEATISHLREICAHEREQRIFFEQTAHAEKALRRECEEQIAIYSAECARMKDSATKNQLALVEKNLTIEDLLTKLSALESILKLLSPEAAVAAPAAPPALPSLLLNQESISAISEERDFLRQENDELRSKLLDERKRAREEKDRLERQIAQYNLFLMMGGANNATDSANSPSASPAARPATSKLESVGAHNLAELPMQSLMGTTS